MIRGEEPAAVVLAAEDIAARPSALDRLPIRPAPLIRYTALASATSPEEMGGMR